MKWISGTQTAWVLAAALLLLPSAARAQQAAPEAVEETGTMALQTSEEEADRETLRRFIAREDVQQVAAVADLDLEKASAGVLALEGEQLSRAADQARALEGKMGSADVISIQATTLIIILLLVLLIVVIAN